MQNVHQRETLNLPPRRGEGARRAVATIRGRLIVRRAVRLCAGQHADDAADLAYDLGLLAGLDYLTIRAASMRAHVRAAIAGAQHPPYPDTVADCYCHRPTDDPLHIETCNTCLAVTPAADIADGTECGAITWPLCMDCLARHAEVCGTCGAP